MNPNIIAKDLAYEWGWLDQEEEDVIKAIRAAMAISYHDALMTAIEKLVKLSQQEMLADNKSSNPKSKLYYAKINTYLSCEEAIRNIELPEILKEKNNSVH